jgi:hypothetical protein
MSTAASNSAPHIPTTGSTRRPPIATGTAVEVRARFDRRWCAGFQVADRIEADAAPVTYRLQRTSDGAILPLLSTADDIIASTVPPTGP